MENICKQEEYKGHTIKLIYDEDAESRSVSVGSNSRTFFRIWGSVQKDIS